MFTDMGRSLDIGQGQFLYLYCLHPAVCQDIWYFDHEYNKYFKYNKSDTTICFDFI
jgi:hypothetical protein